MEEWSRTKKSFTNEELNLIAASLSKVFGSVPPQQQMRFTPLFQMLDANANLIPIPSRSSPVTEAAGMGKLLLALRVRRQQLLPPQQIKADPAAAIFPGAVPQDAPRVTRRVAINTRVPAWHSTGVYAAPGELVTVRVEPPIAGKGMKPSRSTLERLPKRLAAVWESQRPELEVALRQAERVPEEAALLVVSLDGVMVPMKESSRREKRSQPDKGAQGPAGFREAGCGTVVLYDGEGRRLSTVRYGRMPERKKATLKGQLHAEVKSLLAVRADLRMVKLADGAEDNWEFLDRICPEGERIVDFYHACEHLKAGLDCYYVEGNLKGRGAFECLRTVLKEAEDGVEQVIRALKYRRGRVGARGGSASKRS